MPYPVPGFGENAIPPTPEMIEKLRTLGVFQNQIRCFASREDIFNQGGGTGNPIPDSGPPKYWGNPYSNRTPFILRLKRNAEGNYMTAAWDRNKSSPHQPESVWHRTMSASALSVFDTLKLLYPEVRLPLFEIVPIAYEEFGRLSFPLEEIEDPVDYPIAEVTMLEDNYGVSHTFPGTCLIVMWKQKFKIGDVMVEKEVPTVFTVEEAIRQFPANYTPTRPGGGSGGSSSGVDPDKAYAIMLKLAKSSAARAQSSAIFASSDSVVRKIERLGEL